MRSDEAVRQKVLKQGTKSRYFSGRLFIVVFKLSRPQNSFTSSQADSHIRIQITREQLWPYHTRMLMTDEESVCKTSANLNKWMWLSTRDDFIEDSFQNLSSGDFVPLYVSFHLFHIPLIL
jgi:hypothetical protein